MVMVLVVAAGPTRSTTFRLVRIKNCPPQNFKLRTPTAGAAPVFRKPVVDAVTVGAIKGQILFNTWTLGSAVIFENADSVNILYLSSFTGNTLAIGVKLQVSFDTDAGADFEGHGRRLI
ncbi:hypothetical protein D3C85_1392010 [compost metagenome]